MKRKVIQIANSTQLVSLPRKWALENGIKKGDELEINIHNGDLLISTDRKKSGGTRKIAVDIAGLGRHAKRMIGALYRAGYDEMHISFTNYRELQHVQSIVRDGCIGFELIDQGKNFVVLKKVSETLEEEFDLILKRNVMYLMTMATEAHGAIQARDEEQLNYVINMDFSINKFTDFCGRVITNRNQKATSALYPVLLNLEEIGDEYRRLCKFVQSHKGQIPGKYLDLLASINEYLRIGYDLMFKFNLAQLRKSYTTKKDLKTVLEQYMQKSSKADLPFLFILEAMVNLIDNLDFHIIIAECLKKDIKELKN